MFLISMFSICALRVPYFLKLAVSSHITYYMLYTPITLIRSYYDVFMLNLALTAFTGQLYGLIATYKHYVKSS